MVWYGWGVRAPSRCYALVFGVTASAVVACVTSGHPPHVSEGSQPPPAVRQHVPTPADLDALVARVRRSCPEYFREDEPVATEVVRDFPEELRWGYPKLSLVSWFGTVTTIDVAIRQAPGDDCQLVRLSRKAGHVEGTLLVPTDDDPDSREVSRLSVEPVLLHYFQSGAIERSQAGVWVPSGFWAMGCGDTPRALGVLTDVRADRAVYAGQPGVVRSDCRPRGLGCDCPTLVIWVEPDDRECTELGDVSTCVFPAEGAAALQQLPDEPWLERPVEQSPVLYRTMAACLAAAP